VFGFVQRERRFENSSTGSSPTNIEPNHVLCQSQYEESPKGSYDAFWKDHEILRKYHEVFWKEQF
jgi:hypothetical protein